MTPYKFGPAPASVKVRTIVIIGLIILCVGCARAPSKSEVTRIAGETIRNACASWKRCTVTCEAPDPYTGSCEKAPKP